MFKILLVAISFATLTANAANNPPTKPQHVRVTIEELDCRVSNGVVLSTLSRERYGYSGSAIIKAGYFGVWKKMASSYKKIPGETLATITIADRETAYNLKLDLDPMYKEIQQVSGTMYRTKGLGSPGVVGAVSCEVVLSATVY